MIYLFITAYAIMGFLTGLSTMLTLEKKYYSVKSWETPAFEIEAAKRVIVMYILWPYFAASEDLAIRLFVEMKNSPWLERPNPN